MLLGYAGLYHRHAAGCTDLQLHSEVCLEVKSSGLYPVVAVVVTVFQEKGLD